MYHNVDRRRTIFLGCTDLLTAEYFSDRIGVSSVEIEGTMRELNTMRITNYTASYRETNSLGRRQLMTPDEILRIKPDEELVFIRGQKVWKAHRFDYSNTRSIKNSVAQKPYITSPTGRKKLPAGLFPHLNPIKPFYMRRKPKCHRYRNSWKRNHLLRIRPQQHLA